MCRDNITSPNCGGDGTGYCCTVEATGEVLGVYLYQFDWNWRPTALNQILLILRTAALVTALPRISH
jgi:hypothetical protein